MMRRKFKRIQIFFVVTISLFFLIVAAYSQHNNLREADFFCLFQSDENPDPENFSCDYDPQWKAIGPSPLSDMSLLRANLLNPFDCLSFQASPLDQETFVLRC
jgi:hypothetical protein